MTKVLKFPDGFLWGSSTSSYQVEGGIKNNWFEAHHQYLSIVILNLRLRKAPPIQ